MGTPCPSSILCALSVPSAQRTSQHWTSKLTISCSSFMKRGSFVPRKRRMLQKLEKGSSTLEPGEEITSSMKLKDHVTKVVFEIKPNGLMTLTDKFNNKLWTSGVTRPETDGPFRLTYQMDGDLVLYSKDGSRMWASNTKYGNCGNRNPGMVRTEKGSLEILPETTKEGPIWSTKSTNSNGAPTKADDQYWTCGWNKCQEKCVRHCQHANYEGTCHEKGPGDHDIGALGGNDQLSSIEVKNGCMQTFSSTPISLGASGHLRTRHPTSVMEPMMRPAVCALGHATSSEMQTRFDACV